MSRSVIDYATLLVMCAGIVAWPSEARLQEACNDPLPPVRIVTPALDVPKEFAAFQGIWKGSWGGRGCSSIVVEQIEKSGQARVVYTWLDARGPSTVAIYYDGQIAGNGLKFGDVFTFTIFGQSLVGRRKAGDAVSLITALKLDAETEAARVAAAPTLTKEQLVGTWKGRWQTARGGGELTVRFGTFLGFAADYHIIDSDGTAYSWSPTVSLDGEKVILVADRQGPRVDTYILVEKDRQAILRGSYTWKGRYWAFVQLTKQP